LIRGAAGLSISNVWEELTAFFLKGHEIHEDTKNFFSYYYVTEMDKAKKGNWTGA
jgi:hypothetical protein